MLKLKVSFIKTLIIPFTFPFVHLHIADIIFSDFTFYLQRPSFILLFQPLKECDIRLYALKLTRIGWETLGKSLVISKISCLSEHTPLAIIKNSMIDLYSDGEGDLYRSLGDAALLGVKMGTRRAFLYGSWYSFIIPPLVPILIL